MYHALLLEHLQFSSVQSLSRVRLFATPWTAAHQDSLSNTNSRSPPRPMSIESMMPSNHLIFCHTLFRSEISRSVMSDSLQPHESQHARPPCPSPTPGVHSNSHPSSRWCHPAISSSVVPISSCPQPFPASGSFQMSQLFAAGGQSIGALASASVLPMNIQGWFPLGLTGFIFLQSRDSQKSSPALLFESINSLASLPSKILIYTWLLEKP